MSTVKRYCTKSYLAKHPELHIEDYQLIEDLPQSQLSTTSISTTLVNTTVTQQPSSDHQAPAKPEPEERRPAGTFVSWADRQPTAAAIASWADEEWDWLECFDYFHERFPHIPRINPTRAEWEAKQLLLKQQEEEETEKMKQSQPQEELTDLAKSAQADGKAGDEAERIVLEEIPIMRAGTWTTAHYFKKHDEWGDARVADLFGILTN